MLLRYFYDEKLAHASYLVGCQRTGEAIVIDPGRNLEPYFEVAKKEGVNITAATETHIHADFLSGARELGMKYGAKLYLSDEGDENWKYQYISDVNHELVKDGSKFKIGNILFEVMHTPGHTPESISFILTDQGGSADRPMGIFTGDFVFVGDVGRPDLLEKAAGVQGTADSGARALYRSLERFKQLPDYLQVWPAHGAGSACGKALGAVPSSTVGYEKMFNWALQFSDEEAFVKELLFGQPEPPKYFAMMKKLNKIGPALRSEQPVSVVKTVEEWNNLDKEAYTIVDARPSAVFMKGHLPGTINIPYNKSFTNWAGWLLKYDKDFVVLADEASYGGIIKALQSIGLDNIATFADVNLIPQLGVALETYEEAEAVQAMELMEKENLPIIDVRNQTEWNEGHIPNAIHIMLGTLPDRIGEVPQNQRVIVQCRSGARSAIAASILQANGIKEVINLKGGYIAWEKAKLPVTV
ncbi:MAG: rhodanese-like domain-containing protein [Ectobacillus sp.]